MYRVGLILLVVALVLGAAAVWGVRSLATAAGKRPGDAYVVVAARAIDPGQPLTPDVLRAQAWPKNAVPVGAFNTLEDFKATGPQRVALRPIAANEPILKARITGPGGRATLSAQINAGKRAVTVRVNDVFGVAGFVLPGDFVDMFVTRSEEQEGHREVMRTDVLLTSIRVLAIDQTANENKDDPVVAKAVTVEVTPEQAQKLALAGQVGTLSLALRGAADALIASSDQAGTVRVADLRLGGEPTPPVVAKTPIAVRPVSRPRMVRKAVHRVLAPLPAPATMTLYRGAAASEVVVLRD